MNFNKPTIVSKHAIERFEDRRLELTNQSYNHLKKVGSKRFIKSMLEIKNIKSMHKIDVGTKVVTKGNYVLIIAEQPNANVVTTVYRQNRKRLGIKI